MESSMYLLLCFSYSPPVIKLVFLFCASFTKIVSSSHVSHYFLCVVYTCTCIYLCCTCAAFTVIVSHDQLAANSNRCALSRCSRISACTGWFGGVNPMLTEHVVLSLDHTHNWWVGSRDETRLLSWTCIYMVPVQEPFYTSVTWLLNHNMDGHTEHAHHFQHVSNTGLFNGV